MKRFRTPFILIAVYSLLIGGVSVTARGASALAVDQDGLSAVTHMELAVARLATAKYHRVEQALADGYIDTGYVPGEGFEYTNEQLIDCDFNPAQPEILLYAPVPHENRLRLVGVEYVVPLTCTPTAPEGFTGDADVWREDSEGFGLWELNAWIWLHNKNGIFAAPPHPRVP